MADWRTRESERGARWSKAIAPPAAILRFGPAARVARRNGSTALAGMVATISSSSPPVKIASIRDGCLLRAARAATGSGFPTVTSAVTPDSQHSLVRQPLRNCAAPRSMHCAATEEDSGISVCPTIAIPPLVGYCWITLQQNSKRGVALPVRITRFPDLAQLRRTIIMSSQQCPRDFQDHPARETAVIQVNRIPNSTPSR